MGDGLRLEQVAGGREPAEAEAIEQRWIGATSERCVLERAQIGARKQLRAREPIEQRVRALDEAEVAEGLVDRADAGAAVERFEERIEVGAEERVDRERSVRLGDERDQAAGGEGFDSMCAAVRELDER